MDVRVEGPPVERGEEVLTPAALEFVGDLQTRFGAHRDALLAARATRRAEIAAARSIDVREETADVRSGDWQVPPPLLRGVIKEEVAGIGALDRLDDVRRLFEQVALADEFPDFLTLPAYELIVEGPRPPQPWHARVAPRDGAAT